MATVSRADLITRGARVLGARVGTLGTVTGGGSTTTAILLGLVNTTGDSTAFAGWRLFIVAANGTMQEAFITTWADVTGTATFTNLGTPPVITNTYILVAREDYTLYEWRQALDKTFQNARRTYRQVIPTTPNLTLYPLIQCPWLEGAGDIDAVWLNNSPVALHNEDYALWQNGAALAPDGWTLAGSGAAVARVSGGIRSAYAARLTAGGAAATLTQEMPEPLVQWITRRTAPTYIPIRRGEWVVATAANTARVGISYAVAGVAGAEYSDYHSGSGRPEFLTTSVTPSVGMTDIAAVDYVAAGGTGDFHAAVLMQNTQTASLAYSIRDQGSQAYPEIENNRVVRNIGGIPTVEVGPAVWNLQQLIVYCRRPFPLMTSDADVVEEQYARMLVAGLVNFLLEAIKPSQDRTRLDVIRGQQAGIWARALSRTDDLPVPKPPIQYVIMGS